MSVLSLDAFYSQLASLTSARQYVVALSGGVDSMVLLHLMVQLQRRGVCTVHAIHVNHQLQPDAAQWATHCETVCRASGVPFQLATVHVENLPGHSLEAQARARRYQVLTDALQPEAVLLTAHHGDDQVETVLIQLLRGAGVKGLAGMPALKPFSNGWHARPLLAFTREEIVAYARAQALTWVEDQSNLDETLLRNYLRRSVIPSLKKGCPALVQNVGRSAKHCASADAMIAQLAAQQFETLQGKTQYELRVSGLKSFSLLEQKHWVREWIHQVGFPLPSEKKLTEIFCSLIDAKVDAMPCVAWADIEMRRYRDVLYLMRAQSFFDTSQVLPYDDSVSHLKSTVSKSSLTIRFRQGGERLKLDPTRPTQSLKQLMQTWGIPPWQRDRVPLLYDQDVLIGVVGFAINSAYLA